MLQDSNPQHTDIPSLTSISYLYFKDDNPDLQNCAQMFKIVALQIAKANDRFKKHVIAVFDRNQNTFASARRIWQEVFLEFFTKDVKSSCQSLASSAFIIVDGLDEAPEFERLIFIHCLAELLAVPTTKRVCRIQIAIFARPDVRSDLDKAGFGRQERIIEVTPDRNTNDIEAFIKQKLRDVAVL